MLRLSERLERLLSRPSPSSGWPKHTRSLCPGCLKPIEAEMVTEANNVIMVKNCPEHGQFRELIASDVAFFEKMDRNQHSVGRGIDNRGL